MHKCTRYIHIHIYIFIHKYVQCFTAVFVTAKTGINPMSTERKMKKCVQLLSCVRLFATLWTAARQASLSITNSQSLLKLMSIESVMSHPAISSSTVLFSSCLQSFPSIRVFSKESVLHIR